MLSSLKKNTESNNKTQYPDWVLEGPPITKKLYDATELIYSELLEKIHSGKIDGLDLYNGPIVKAHIAQRAGGKSASNIRKDRQETFLTYLRNKNSKLLELVRTIKPKNKNDKRKTKADLEQENKKLKNKINELEQEKYREFFKQIINSQLLKKQKDLALQNEKLLIEVANNDEIIRNLRKQVNQFMMQLNTG